MSPAEIIVEHLCSQAGKLSKLWTCLVSNNSVTVLREGNKTLSCTLQLKITKMHICPADMISVS